MKYSFLIVLLALVTILGCGKVSDFGSPALKTASLNLVPPGNVSIAGITAICNTDLNAADRNYTYGFCYGLTRNPGIPGLASGSNNYNAGSFSAPITDLQYGKKYYVRAFITNGLVTNYSNQDSFAMPNYLSTEKVKNITSKTFDVDIHLQETPADAISQKGICYGTKTKPTINDFTAFAATTDTGYATISVTDTLKAGTVYYVRSVVVTGDKAFYGTELSFTAAGYRGGSGGYIFFDKGDTAGGWRYLEAAPDTITVANATWGCASTTVLGTLAAIGTGLDNSNAIIAACTEPLAAVNICDALLLKNKTDWFLPSLDELTALYNLKLSGIIKNHNLVLFSSTQASVGDCYVVDFSSGLQWQLGKDVSTAFIWPVRRF
jgi:hypothetical protein